MSTKRTPISRTQRPQISDEVLTLFRRARSIQDVGDDVAWEHDGGKRREFLDACVELEWALGRRPWQDGIFDVSADTDVPSRDDHDTAGAVELRRSLELRARQG